ncbi:MAG: molybdopterin-dependent oxidoreductase [Candidatus Marinimicrobia bacterium]|nr:molybdopterin-dependent oxidoreductase [Candidatus Neomarinimicrobiota bacterium]
MTSQSNTLNRRDFIKLSTGSTAALVLGLSWSCDGNRVAKASNATFSPNAYLEIGSDDTVRIVMPRSEMGQKIYTSLPMILAEELEADWTKVKVIQGDLNEVFGSQSTGGSASIRTQYDILRKAGATAKTMLIQAAAASWQVPVEKCYASEGVVYHKDSKRKSAYGKLVGQAAKLPVPTEVTLKDPRKFKIIGKAYKSLDGRSKVDGSLKYGYDFHLPGMLTAVISRIPRYGSELEGMDDSAALTVPGVLKVVKVSSGVAVIAKNSYAALEGRKKLELTWSPGPHASLNSSQISADLNQALDRTDAIIRDDGDVEQARRSATKTVDLTFEVPYLDHAPQEPNNCTAHFHDGICEIWAPSQNPGNGFNAAKRITGLNDHEIIIHTLRMGGGFGRRLQADYVADAVEVAQHSDSPVKVIRTRDEDIKNGFYRPASVHRASAGVDQNGAVTFWQHQISGPAAGWHGMITGGATEHAYAIPNQKISYSMSDLPVPIGAWRSVANTQTAFVNECLLDEIAIKSDQDPVELRRRLLKDHPRRLGVLNLAAEKANWGKKLPDGHAAGVAVHKSFQSYVAIVAEVSQEKSGKIRVEKITAAIDVGTVINPDGVRSQVEGGVIMALTAALYGEITIEKGAVKQSNFHNYPLLKFSETPVIETHIVKSMEKPTGAGEPPVPPTPPALLNAICALTGERITRLPFS